MNVEAVISCYAEAFDAVMISPEGVQVIKTDLELMGVDTFIKGIEWVLKNLCLIFLVLKVE